MCVCVSTFLFSHFLIGQKLTSFNFDNPTRGIDVKELNDGGYLLTGNVFYPENGRASSVLIKTNATGELLWKKSIDSEGSSFGWSLMELNDHYYLLGFSDLNDTTRVLLTKTNQDGGVVWERKYGDATSQIGWSLLSRGENLLIIGETTTESGKKSAWIFNVDQDGNMSWESETGMENNMERTFYGSEVSRKDIIVAGINAKQEKVDDDILAMRIDGKGKIVWKKIVEVGKKRDVGHAVKTYGKNAYVYGYYQLDSIFNPVVTQISITGKDSKVIKIQMPEHDVRIMNGEKTDEGHVLVGYSRGPEDQFFKACILEVSDDGELISYNTYGERGLNTFYGIRKTSFGYAIAGSVTKNGKAELTLVLLGEGN